MKDLERLDYIRRLYHTLQTEKAPLDYTIRFFNTEVPWLIERLWKFYEQASKRLCRRCDRVKPKDQFVRPSGHICKNCEGLRISIDNKRNRALRKLKAEVLEKEERSRADPIS